MSSVTHHERLDRGDRPSKKHPRAWGLAALTAAAAIGGVAYFKQHQAQERADQAFIEDTWASMPRGSEAVVIAEPTRGPRARGGTMDERAARAGMAVTAYAEACTFAEYPNLTGIPQGTPAERRERLRDLDCATD